MKALLVALFFAPVMALAQSVDVKGAEGDSEGTTTIQIKKTKNTEDAAKGEVKWEVTEGAADIEGEPAAMNKEARATWKTACEDWKKEFRADNKENKIISMSCGTPTCDGNTGNKVCTSKAAYKVKTKLN
jgi:hypothetical protein